MIGDVLTSSILFEALKKEYPKAELHYLIYRHTLAVVENNPFIDKIIPFDKQTEKPLRLYTFLKGIKREKYDVIIDVYSKIGTAIISSSSGAKITVSYDKWYTRKFYTHTVSRNTKAETAA
ncbi:glycosyltransferase family 9 protein [Antarcticibacterium sp. 1MA-6-2]|uniref:glycosyltransferase family 9 protein n=1 Tax=Antarcticibacterium sp. 1MA-6-2 TaxID=2908210 RepID=UPI0028832EBE|nr:glycosyltransferase family 9 protein [Antarcticibacterium sp. 1MA-6-2]